MSFVTTILQQVNIKKRLICFFYLIPKKVFPSSELIALLSTSQFMSPSNKLHWRRKLHAFLHDSPDKACDIAGHESRAAMIKALDQFGTDDKFSTYGNKSKKSLDILFLPLMTKIR
jgi:hypothetical protein